MQADAIETIPEAITSKLRQLSLSFSKSRPTKVIDDTKRLTKGVKHNIRSHVARKAILAVCKRYNASLPLNWG